MTSPLRSTPDYDDTAAAFGAGPEPDAEDAPARRQPGQLVELLVEDQEPYTVRILNRDRIAYEKSAARHKEWPSPAAGQNFAMTFVCWNAAKRAGHTELTFDQFCDVLEDYNVVEQAPADPTR